jgi:hypothetical protein
VNLLGDLTRTSQRYWKRAGSSIEVAAKRRLEVVIHARNLISSSD